MPTPGGMEDPVISDEFIKGIVIPFVIVVVGIVIACVLRAFGII